MRMFSFPGERVLDPFLGSGTTMAVAAQEGRDCVGYEIDPAMRAVIEERLGTGEPAFEHEYTCTIEDDGLEPPAANDVGGQDARPTATDSGLRDRVADPADWDFGPRTSAGRGGSTGRLLALARELAAGDGWADIDRAARIERLVSAMGAGHTDESLLRAGIRNALQRSAELRGLVDDVQV